MHHSIHLIKVCMPLVCSLTTVVQSLSQLLIAFTLSQRSPFSSTQILWPPDDSPSPQMTTSVPKWLPKSLRLLGSSQFLQPPDVSSRPQDVSSRPVDDSFSPRTAVPVPRELLGLQVCWTYQQMESPGEFPYLEHVSRLTHAGMHLWSILFPAVCLSTVQIHLCWHLDGRSPSKCPMY